MARWCGRSRFVVDVVDRFDSVFVPRVSMIAPTASALPWRSRSRSLARIVLSAFPARRGSATRKPRGSTQDPYSQDRLDGAVLMPPALSRRRSIRARRRSRSPERPRPPHRHQARCRPVASHHERPLRDTVPVWFCNSAGATPSTARPGRRRGSARLRSLERTAWHCHNFKK